VITSLQSDVCRLLTNNLTVKAGLGREIVWINNEACHSAEEVKHWIVVCVSPAAGSYEHFLM
jgi:hypothetical protein